MKVVGLLARDMCLKTLSCAISRLLSGLGVLVPVNHTSWKGHSALTGISFPAGVMLNAILRVAFDWFRVAPHVASGENNSSSII